MTHPARPVDRPGDHPFDQGLQPERTALAWRRTSLSLTVGALVGTRVLPHFWGASELIIAGAGVIASLAVMTLAHRRYRTHHHRLTTGQAEHRGLPDGRLPAITTITTLAAAIIALVLAITITI